MWYVHHNDKTVGPVNFSDIVERVDNGSLPDTVLIWKEGMDNWEIFHNIRENEPSTKPPLPGTADFTRNQYIDKNSAPWSRFFARLLDLYVISVVFSVSIGFFLLLNFPYIFIAVTSENYTILWVILFSIVPIPVLALQNLIFGNTLGKYLFGVNIYKLDGRKPSFFDYIKREAGALFYGMGLNVPIVTLFTMWSQYKNVRETGESGYDAGKFNALEDNRSVLKSFIGVLLFVVSVGFLLASTVSDKEDQRKLTQVQSWENPLTGQSAQISQTWERGEITNDRKRLYHFNSVLLLSDALFAYERVSTSLLTDGMYVEALEKALDSTFKFQGKWEKENFFDREMFTNYGAVTENPNVNMKIFVFIDNNDAWRLIFLSNGRKYEEVPTGVEFIDSMFSTVPK